MEQKLAHARAFREHFQLKRPILVDSLDGRLHRAYGMLPNMTYIVGRNGRVLYRSNWTDAYSLRVVLDYLLHERQVRRERVRPAPFYMEVLGHRPIDRAGFMRGLLLAGERAAREFIEATRRHQGDRAVQQLEKLLEQVKGSSTAF